MISGPRWRAAALLIGAFLAGIAVGSFGSRWLGPRFWGREGRPTAAHAVDVLGRRLSLRPSQRDSVRAIFERRRPAFDSLWREMGPRIDTLEHAVSREIEAQLDPDQRTKYADLRRRSMNGAGTGPPRPRRRSEPRLCEFDTGRRRPQLGRRRSSWDIGQAMPWLDAAPPIG